MTKTDNYNLNQWAPHDEIKVEDFNADNAAVDAALNQCAKIAVGSYVGTGAYGAQNPNKLTFEFEPKLVMIFKESVGNGQEMVAFLRNQTHYSTFNGSTGYGICLWDGNVFSWYSTYDDSYNPGWHQFNYSGITYCYLAIG